MMKKVRKIPALLALSMVVFLSTCEKKQKEPVVIKPQIAGYVTKDDVHFPIDVKGNRMGPDEPHELVDYLGDSRHKPVDATCEASGVYYKQCSTCYKIISFEIPKIGHSFANWEVTTEPTCSNKGVKVRTCEACGITESEEIPVNTDAHSWIDDSTADRYATCTLEGVSGSKICEICQEKKTGTSIPKLPHELTEWEVSKEATATEEGIRERHCSNCDYVETETFELEVPPVNQYPTENYYDGYYVPISSWENGEDLKNQLHNLIRTGFTGLSYEGNWETNQVADQALDNFTNVNVVYSQVNELKTSTYASTNTTGWQREHAFCASLMTAYNTGDAVGISNSGSSRATDFHNLFASYGPANGGRGNKNFGVYNPDEEVVNPNAVNADTKADKKNYEPNDCDKGRLARAIFYMGVMYNEDEESALTLKYPYGTSSNKSVKITAKYKPLQIVENYVDYSQVTFKDFCKSSDESVQALRDTYLAQYRSDTSAYNVSSSPDETILNDFGKAYADYRYAEGCFAIGNLSTLLEWSEKPVDRQEMWHNEAVYSYIHQSSGANNGKKQGNRNPFVDYPELVDYIYGSKKDQPGHLGNLRPSEDILETNKKETYNYALTSYKNKYLVGEKLTSADYSFVKVNKDFTTENADFTDTNEEYTFVEGDIGKKTITLSTPSGNVSYVVDVESAGGINACNYTCLINKNTVSVTKISDADNPIALFSSGGVTFNVSSGIKECALTRTDNYVQFGSASTGKNASTLIIESANDFSYEGKTNISSIYVGLNTAASTTYNYEFYIGGELVDSGTFGRNSAPVPYGKDLESPKSGKVKIVLTNVSKAVYVSQISIKVN